MTSMLSPNTHQQNTNAHAQGPECIGIYSLLSISAGGTYLTILLLKSIFLSVILRYNICKYFICFPCRQSHTSRGNRTRHSFTWTNSAYLRRDKHPSSMYFQQTRTTSRHMPRHSVNEVALWNYQGRRYLMYLRET